MVAYCTADEVVAQMGLTSSTGARGEIAAAAVEDATAWIDQYCGRDFNKLTEVREFSPASRGLRVVETGDLFAATAVATRPDRRSPWVALDAADWALEPGPDGQSRHPQEPAQAVLLYSDVAAFPWKPPPETTVQVSATFGWPSVPGPVRRACVVIAARFTEFMSRPGFESGQFNPADAVGSPVGSVSEAIRTLTPYRRIVAA